jgi:hypothetical protein
LLVKRLLVASAVLLACVAVMRPAPVSTHQVVTTSVTYDKEISRIIRKRCLACHSQNNLGVPLTTYEETRPWAIAIHEELLKRHMPPWRAVAGYRELANDPSMTSREMQFFLSWIEGNGPRFKLQGTIINVDQFVTPESDRLTADFATWQLGDPNLTKAFAPQAVAAGQGLTAQRVELDLGLKAPRWMRALDFKPSDRRVVRSVTFYLQSTGQWLGTWTPWQTSTSFPDGAGIELPAGAKVDADFSYQSADVVVMSGGTLGLYFAKAPMARPLGDSVVTLSPKAGKVDSDGHQRYIGTVTLPRGTTLVSFLPELRRGISSLAVTTRRADGASQILLIVKNILTDWPTPYVLKDPLTLPTATELIVTAGVQDGVSTATDPIRFVVRTLPAPDARSTN